MVFSTKMRETGQRSVAPQQLTLRSEEEALLPTSFGKPNNIYQNTPSKPATYYKINMFENLKSSAECSDCKKSKPNLIK